MRKKNGLDMEMQALYSSDDVAERLVPLAYSMAYSLLRRNRIPESDAEDFAQECYLEAIKILRRSDTPDTFEGIYALVVRRINYLLLDVIRRRKPLGYRSHQLKEDPPATVRLGRIGVDQIEYEFELACPHTREPEAESEQQGDFEAMVDELGLGRPFPEFVGALVSSDGPDAFRRACHDAGVSHARGRRLLEDAREVITRRRDDFPAAARLLSMIELDE